MLPAGVVAVAAPFGRDDPIEIVSADGSVVAKGITRLPSDRAGEWLGHRLADLPADLAGELVHRDDLVVLAGATAARRTRSPRRTVPR